MSVTHVLNRGWGQSAVLSRVHLQSLSEVTLAVPIVLVGIFTWHFAVPDPLTDEWLFFRNGMIAHDMGWSDPIHTLSAMTWRIYEHPVIIPNLIYLAVAPIFHYDARAFISITIICFAGILAVFRMKIAPNTWAALPAAFVLFAPTHYMEFLWGVQFAMAMSITATVAGLALFHSVKPEESTSAFAKKLLASLGLIIAGLLSSGEAVLGFPALAVLALLMPLPANRRRVVLGISVIALGVALALIGAPVNLSTINIPSSLMVVLTGLGCVLIGSNVGVFSFGFSWAAVIGLGVCLVVGVCVLVAWRQRRMREIAFPLALFAYGVLLLAAISVARPYLGNWHLQAALPAILGAYGLTLTLAKGSGSRMVLLAKIAGIALISVAAFGFWKGFTWFGPGHNYYAVLVSDYMHNYLVHPDAPKPFPHTAEWDFDPAMAQFLKNNGPHR